MTSYTPNSNGLVERMNKEIWKKIRAGFVKFNSLEWVQHLQQYVNNINNQRQSTTKFRPNDLWKPGYNPTKNPKTKQKNTANC